VRGIALPLPTERDPRRLPRWFCSCQALLASGSLADKLDPPATLRPTPTGCLAAPSNHSLDTNRLRSGAMSMLRTAVKRWPQVASRGHSWPHPPGPKTGDARRFAWSSRVVGTGVDPVTFRFSGVAISPGQGRSVRLSCPRCALHACQSCRGRGLACVAPAGSCIGCTGPHPPLACVLMPRC
jgi:hypothetical protein